MRGFLNHGNTCYFSAALHALLNAHPVSTYIKHEPYTGSCAFTLLYKRLIDAYFEDKDEGALSIQSLLEAFYNRFPSFRDRGQQHDAQEAVLCMIDILEKAIPQVSVFIYGTKTQEVIYPGGKKNHEHPFCIQMLSARNGTLAEALHKSMEWNVLDDYKDDHGIVHHVATTREIITTQPRVLFISFDTKSDVNVYENTLKDYELVASVVHGGSQYGGHYGSFVKRGNTWYFNDDDVTTKDDFPIRCGHYLLTYISKIHPT